MNLATEVHPTKLSNEKQSKLITCDQLHMPASHAIMTTHLLVHMHYLENPHG